MLLIYSIYIYIYIYITKNVLKFLIENFFGDFNLKDRVTLKMTFLYIIVYLENYVLHLV